jgi:uncharacterized membrane protein
MLATINTPKVQAPFGVSLLHLVLIIQGYNHSGLFVGSMLLIFLVCCVVLLLCFYVLYVFFLHLEKNKKQTRVNPGFREG